MVVVVLEVVVVVGRTAGAHAENSDVSPAVSVAVAVRDSVDASTARESAAVNAACPTPSVVIDSTPTRSAPSP